MPRDLPTALFSARRARLDPFPGARGCTRRRSRALSRRRAPFFELLEDRRLLHHCDLGRRCRWGLGCRCSNWKDEANVSRVPGPGDDVFLDRPTGVFTVTHGSTGSSTVRSLHADRNGFVLSAGSLTITAASELRGAVTLSGGNLDLDGPLTTAGTTTWTVGLLDGGTAGLTNTGTLTLADSGLKRLSGNLFNAGNVIHGQLPPATWSTPASAP